MTAKTDLRVLRTKKAIKEAFFKLLEEKKYEKITIQEIAEEAMINRNTFYLHYMDKEDLVGKLSAECLNDLEETLNHKNLSIKAFTEEDLYQIIRGVFETISKEFDFYKVGMSDDSIPYFAEKFKECIRAHISQGYPQSHTDKGHKEAVYIEYIVSGFVGVIKFWLSHSAKYSVEEIEKLLFEMHVRNVIDTLKKNY